MVENDYFREVSELLREGVSRVGKQERLNEQQMTGSIDETERS